MEIKGKIIEILPEKSGQSANGEWRKQEYILETDTNYPDADYKHLETPASRKKLSWKPPKKEDTEE